MYTCSLCSERFSTPEALSSHLDNLIMKSVCSCQSCGQFFGPDFQCTDAIDKGILHCLLCKASPDTCDLKSRDIKNPELIKEERRDSDTKKHKKMLRKRNRDASKYSKVRNKYAHARKKYLNEVKKINKGSCGRGKSEAANTKEVDYNMTTLCEVELTDRSDDETDLCMFCSKEVPLSELTKHESKHRSKKAMPLPKGPGDPAPEPIGEANSLCFICGEVVKREKFKYHKQLHKRMICDICGFTSNTIKKHMISHSDQRKHSCEICGLSFKTSRNLKTHNLVHTDVGKHQCSTCDKRFKTPYNLRVHMRSHMDRKPFECEVCYKSFTTKQSRDNHTKTHK